MAYLERINICFENKSRHQLAQGKAKGYREKICNHSSATWLCNTESPNYNDADRDGNYIWSCNLLGDLDSDPLFPSSVLSAMQLESICLKVA